MGDVVKSLDGTTAVNSLLQYGTAQNVLPPINIFKKAA